MFEGDHIEDNDSLKELSAEFLTPSLGPSPRNGYLTDKECSTPSTVPLGISPRSKAPSLGSSRFQVDMLRDKYKTGTTNIYIDYSTVVG